MNKTMSAIALIALSATIIASSCGSALAQNDPIVATDFIDLGLDTSTEDGLALEELGEAAPKTTQIVSYKPNKTDLTLQGGSGAETVPLSLHEAETLEASYTFKEDTNKVPYDIRNEAIKEAAISYGARAGLAWRTYYIRREIDRRGRSLSRIYNFRQLLIPAPSGLLIEPPIISENINSMLIDGDGQQAAVSDRIYNIVNNAKIVAAARTWRTYLERHWGDVAPPPDLLRPQNDEERDLWIKLVRKGWDEGVRQANEIFQQDINQLVADFEGMVRYRMLLAQGMVSAPYALQVDRGVTGDGDQMRVGDRAIQITGKPSLITGYDKWEPASR